MYKDAADSCLCGGLLGHLADGYKVETSALIVIDGDDMSGFCRKVDTVIFASGHSFPRCELIAVVLSVPMWIRICNKPLNYSFLIVFLYIKAQSREGIEHFLIKMPLI